MTDVDEIKSVMNRSRNELDMAMDACGPEYDQMIKNVEETREDFLTVWNDFKKQKTNSQEFLMVSKKFAETLQARKEMFVRFRKIISPLQSQFEKTCKIFHNMDENVKDESRGRSANHG
jgi:anion-transporting  ArsA/GET3 family ATPase